MARINANLNALAGLGNLGTINQRLAQVFQRLSSGNAINQAEDNPSGLIISEQLRAEMGALRTRIDAVERAGNALATGEGALGQISDILQDVRANAVAAANTAGLPDEAAQAIQAQIDNSLESIDRIAASADFGSQPLFNGDYTVALDDAEITLDQAAAAYLGGEDPLSTIASGQANAVTENPTGALAVIDAAIADVASRRGEIGGFLTQQVGSAIEEFSVALENVTAANSRIRDADFAVEAANLAREQLLQNADLSVLASANSTNDTVLRLLGG